MLILLCVCTCVCSWPAENDSRMGAPESTQAIGIPASVHTPQPRPDPARGNQPPPCPKYFCSDGVKACLSTDGLEGKIYC